MNHSSDNEPPLSPKPFTVEVGAEVLRDLRARIRATRWPDDPPAEPWEQGTDPGYLRQLLARWADGFDWPARQRALNGFAHYRAEVDGVLVHFVHQPARHGQGIPLILGHGWPSAFTELLPLVPLLTDPAAHSIDGPAFDLVIPSLPGYGFSERPARTGVGYRTVAALWHRLMEGLGYRRYAAGGGDFGAGVATLMALDRPEAVLGLHLSSLELAPCTGPGSRPLSTAERDYLADSEQWWQREGGYKAVQSTRPQTLGYALADSPAGLAAWITEKWHTWSDPRFPVDQDFLLELLTLYWATGTITSSMRDYYDNRWHAVRLGPEDRVAVPTAIARFVHQRAFEGDPPREWAERLYQVRRWRPMERGGHFAPVEQPELLARDICAFFGEL